jgi:hypothetical protein
MIIMYDEMEVMGQEVVVANLEVLLKYSPEKTEDRGENQYRCGEAEKIRTSYHPNLVTYYWWVERWCFLMGLCFYVVLPMNSWTLDLWSCH